MTKRKPRYIEGAVLMLDLDLYLDRVRRLAPEDEWSVVDPVYASVETLAEQHDFHLVRIFGDGFLLYSQGKPNQDLLEMSVTFLVALRDQLGQHSFTFKAALVGGTLVLAERRSKAGEIETVVAGAIANTAGKAIRKAGRGTLALNWPLQTSSLVAETFETISAGRTRRAIIVPLSALAPNIDPFSLKEIEESALTTPAEIASFSSNVKGAVFDTIKMADDKAKSIFAVSGGFLVYLFDGRVDPSELFVFCGTSHLIRLSSWLAAMLLFLGSSFFALKVLYPRTGTTHKGLLFYGSIRLWGDATSYADRLKGSSPADLARESAIHNFDLSGVAERKYIALRRSIWTMGLGILSALMFLGTQWLLFPKPPQ